MESSSLQHGPRRRCMASRPRSGRASGPSGRAIGIRASGSDPAQKSRPMERLVLVHGSVVNGAMTWRAQRPLAGQFELVVVERPGFPPNPPVERVDFEPDSALVADLLQDGDHLVGHSYGGGVALLA